MSATTVNTMSLDLSERIKAGLQHHQSGRLMEAEVIYEKHIGPLIRALDR